jgi:hypothetical protein
VHNRTGGSEDNLIGIYSIEGLAKEQRNFWTLSIRDSGAGNVGHLASWSLTLALGVALGHFDRCSVGLPQRSPRR